jgi:hypothetical protein
MRLKNISQVAVFTELVRKKLPEGLQGKTIIDNIAIKRSFSLRILGSPKFIEETKEHVRVKNAIIPKDGTVYDFMLRSPNDESEVVNSPLLVLSENTQTIQFRKFDNEIDETSQTEFVLVERLLKENNIEGFNLSYPTDSVGDIFPLIRIFPSYCPLCKREHSSENAYIVRNKKSFSFSCYRANQEKQPGVRNPRLKLSFSETALDREKKLPSPIKLSQPRITDPNDCFVWGDLIDMCSSGRKFPVMQFTKRFKQRLLVFKQQQNFGFSKWKIRVVAFSLKWLLNWTLLDT